MESVELEGFPRPDYRKFRFCSSNLHNDSAHPPPYMQYSACLKRWGGGFGRFLARIAILTPPLCNRGMLGIRSYWHLIRTKM